MWATNRGAGARVLALSFNYKRYVSLTDVRISDLDGFGPSHSFGLDLLPSLRRPTTAFTLDGLASS